MPKEGEMPWEAQRPLSAEIRQAPLTDCLEGRLPPLGVERAETDPRARPVREPPHPLARAGRRPLRYLCRSLLARGRGVAGLRDTGHASSEALPGEALHVAVAHVRGEGR